MDLMTQIGNIFGRRQQPGQYMGNPMPTMSRYDFGANDGAAVYASRMPNMRGFRPEPMVEPAPAEMSPAQPAMGGAQGLTPRVAPVVPQMGAQGMQPAAAPSLPDMGGAQGLKAPGGLLDEASAGTDWKGIGNKMRAFGRGGDESGRGQGESMYAPLPSVMSAGPVGGRAGGDINVLQFMRGMARR